MRAGAAAEDVTIKAKPPSAMNATGAMINTYCQNVYGKPGALFSVNRLSDTEAPQGSLASVSSAERWSGIPEPTNMRLPNGWGAAETGVTSTYLRMPKN